MFTHAPATHPRLVVHGSPSSGQVVPSAAFGFEHSPVRGSHVPAVWHASSAPHVFGDAPVQVPAWQVSTVVQPLPSSQVEPFPLIGFEHAPVSGSQVPASWHWSDAAHTIGLAPTHAPAPSHVSMRVHASPSLHSVVDGAGGSVHTPVWESQTPGR